MKQITLEKFLASKTYMKNEVTQFGSPTELMQPFIDTAEGANASVDTSIKVEREVVNENTDKTKNISFGRASMEISYPTLDNSECTHKVGVLYGLDTSRPVIKVYSGVRVHACLNLSVFNAQNFKQFDLLVAGNRQGAIEYSQELLANADDDFRASMETIQAMKDVNIGAWYKFQEILGHLALRCAKSTKIGLRAFNFALGELVEPKSIYYYNPENGMNLWKLYNAFTQYVTDKSSIVDAPNLTVGINEMILDLLPAQAN